MGEPGAGAAYEAARLAHGLGRGVREMRERLGWSSRTSPEPRAWPDLQ